MTSTAGRRLPSLTDTQVFFLSSNAFPSADCAYSGLGVSRLNGSVATAEMVPIVRISHTESDQDWLFVVAIMRMCRVLIGVSNVVLTHCACAVALSPVFTSVQLEPSSEVWME